MTGALVFMQPRHLRPRGLGRHGIGGCCATDSMRMLDPASGRCSAEATPSTGNQTRLDFYAALLRGEATIERGEHAVFLTLTSSAPHPLGRT